MRLLVGADWHFRNVRVHGAVGEHEHDIGAAGAAIAPAFQLDRGQVRHEIGFPHVIAGADSDEVAFAGEVFLLSGARAEIEIAAKDKILIVKDVHHHRQICGADQERALGAAAVEMAIAGIKRNREQAFFAPFEGAPAAVGEFELRRAMTLEHVNDFFVEMPLRRRRSAGADGEQKHIGEIAAALEMNRRAVDVVARPGRGLDREQIDAVVLGDRNGFAGKPVEIRIDAVARLGLTRFALRRLTDVHAVAPGLAAAIIIDCRSLFPPPAKRWGGSANFTSVK